MKSTTVSKFQAAMAAEVEAEQAPSLEIFVTPEDTIQDVADQIRVRAEDNGKSVAPEEVARAAAEIVATRDDPFVGMALDIEPDEAYGMIQSRVRAWLDDRGIIAQEDEIRAKTNDLYGAAQSTAPRTAGDLADRVEAALSDALAGELPGMPPKPAPKMVMRVPSDAEFGQDGEEFFISSPLRARADVLIDRHPDLFEHLSGMSLTYLWKKAGGKSKGAPILGKTQKPAGLLKLFSESTFVIWLAADHCRSRYYGDPEIEQLLFHEMLHTAVGEPDEETGRDGRPVLVPHQLEIFDAEIEVYGLEGIALKEAAPLFRQAVYDSPTEAASPATYPDPIVIERGPYNTPDGWLRHPDGSLLSDDEIAARDLSGAGMLVHDDNTPMTAAEIEEQEAAELRDDPAEFDDEDVEDHDLIGADDRPRQALRGSTEG